MSEEKLEFGMNLSVDLDNFKKTWKEQEASIQAVINKSVFGIKLEVDKTSMDSAKADAKEVGKGLSESLTVGKNSIKEMLTSIKKMRAEAYRNPLTTEKDLAGINNLLQSARKLETEVKTIKASPLNFSEIMKIGDTGAQGIQLKARKAELQAYLDVQKEGTKEAIRAKEELIKVNERIANMQGKGESSLKSTDEEKRTNNIIAAYKKLEAEQASIIARIRERISLEKGSVISTSKVDVSTQGTKQEINGYNELTATMNKYKNSLSKVNQEKLKATATENTKKQTTNLRQELAIQEKIKNSIDSQNTKLANKEALIKSAAESKKISDTVAAYKKLEAEQTKIIAQIRERVSLQQGTVVSTSGISVTSQGTAQEIAGYNQLSVAMAKYKASLSETNQEKLKSTATDTSQKQITNLQQELSIQEKINVSIQKQATQWNRYAAILEKPEATLVQIKSKINQIEKITPKLKMDATQANNAKVVLDSLRQKMVSLQPSAQSLKVQLSALEAQWSRLSIAERKGATGKQLIAKYQNLTKEAGKLKGTLKSASSTIDANTNAFRRQRGMLNGMPQMLNSYISILGGFRLINSIRQTTGQFELQRVALGAIIQDTEKANALFEQIKVKAVESPFMVKDLVTYTKQLAAFRVETENLFETTNRLADISAGLGVDMSRLILAYGQVKAASVLRGQELRQFTEAGIPLVQMLADKFTILNGQATTTGDVFSMISKRAVPFSMIKEIFEDMTNEGGVFFNMQEIQSKTLLGLYNNLSDAIQIMFDDMGRANRGVLVGFANAARYLATNWRGVAVALGSVASAIISYNVVATIAGAKTKFLEETEKLLTKAELLNAKAVKLQTANNIAAAKATTAAAVATTAAANANNIFTRSFYKLKAAILANPYTAIIVAVTTLAGIIYSFSQYESKATIKTKELNATISRMKAASDTSVVSLNGLLDKLKNTTKGSKEYEDIINQINKKSSAFTDNQLSIADSYDTVAESVKKVTTAIMEKAKAEAYSAGVTKIEQDFTDTSSKLYDKALGSLTGKRNAIKLDENEARVFLSGISDSIKNSPELYKTSESIVDLLSKEMSAYAKKSGQKTHVFDVNDLFSSEFSKYGNVTALADFIANRDSSLKKGLGDLNSKLNTTFNTGNVENYQKEINEVAKTYGDLLAVIEKKDYSQEKSGKMDADILQNRVDKLNAMIAVYKKFDQKSLVAKTKAELNQLLKVGDDWETLVLKLAGSGAGAIYKKQQSEDYFGYVERLKKEYSDLIKQQKEIGEFTPDIDKNLINNRLKVVESISKALGVSLTSGGGSSDRITQLKEEMKYIESAYQEYQKLLKTESASSAQKDVKNIYSDKRYNLAFSDEDIDAMYGSMIPKFRALGKGGSKALSDTIIKQNKFRTTSIIDGFETNLDRIGREISQTEAARTLYDKIFGINGNADLAASVAGKSLVNKNLKTLLENQVKATFESLDIATPDSMDLGKLQETVDSLFATPERQSKAQGAVDNLKTYINDTTTATIKLNNELKKLEGKGFDLTGEGVDFDISKVEKSRTESLAKITEEQKGMEADTLSLKEANGEEWYNKEMARIAAIYKIQKDNVNKLSNLKIEAVRDDAAMKLSALYQKAFGNIEKYGVSTLKRLQEGMSDVVDTAEQINAGGKTMIQVSMPTEQLDKDGKVITKTTTMSIEEFTKWKNKLDDITNSLEKYNPFYTATQSWDTLMDAFKSDDKDALPDAVKSFTTDAKAASDQVVEWADNIKTLFGEDSNIGSSISEIASIVDISTKLGSGMGKFATGDITGGITDSLAALDSAAGMASADRKEQLEDIKEDVDNLQDLVGVIDDVIDKQKELLATIATSAINDEVASTTALIEKQVEAARKQGVEYLNTGANISNHSLGYELEDDLDDYKDKIEALGISWDAIRGSGRMEGLFDLTPSQLSDLKYGIPEAWAKLDDSEEYMLQTIIDSDDALQDLRDTADEALTDLTFDDAKDSLQDLLEDTDTTLSDISDNMEETFRKAIVNSLMKDGVSDALQGWYDAFSKDMEDGVLDNADDLKALYTSIWADAENKRDAAYEAAGVDDSSSSSLTGISRTAASITEDEAKELGGYMNQVLYYEVAQYNIQTAILEKMGDNDGSTLTNLYAIQASSLEYIKGIKTDTGKLVDTMNKLVMTGGKSMNVRLTN